MIREAWLKLGEWIAAYVGIHIALRGLRFALPRLIVRIVKACSRD